MKVYQLKFKDEAEALSVLETKSIINSNGELVQEMIGNELIGTHRVVYIGQVGDDFRVEVQHTDDKLFFGSNEIREVPKEIALWRLRAVLEMMGKRITVEAAINSLQGATKIGAFSVWEYGESVSRNSQTILFIQQVLKMSNSEVDEIFKQADLINI